VARQKRSRELTKDDWDEAIKLFLDLERPEFRKKVEKLARELEREGLAAHRAADRLEGLTHGGKHVRPSDHARSAVLARLERWYTPQHLHLPERQLDRLAETGLHGPGQLRRQASTILDAAEFIGTSLRHYEEFVAEHRSSGRGPRPSLAMDTVETMMIEWGVGPTETAKHLAAEGIHVTVESLKMRLSSRRRRARQHGR
jgi:hypothetical protein